MKSRKELLKLTQNILKNAEKERLDIAQEEADKGIQYNIEKDELLCVLEAAKFVYEEYMDDYVAEWRWAKNKVEYNKLLEMIAKIKGL